MENLFWKRVYDRVEAQDGYRILVDRLWPRGLSKQAAALDDWAKEITPTTAIRQAYHKGIISYEAFSFKYEEELDKNFAFVDFVVKIKKLSSEGPVTLVYASKNPERSHIPSLRNKLNSAIKDIK